MNVIYRAGLQSHSGEVYDVTIETDSYYTAAAQTIALTTDEPLILERRQEELFAPIVSTSATVRVLVDDTTLIRRILLDELRGYIRIAQSDQTVFVGVIESGLHEEEYDQAPYTVELSAGCGLMRLQDYPPYLDASIDASGQLAMSLDALIKSCLKHADAHISPSSLVYRTQLEPLANLYIDARRWLFDERGQRNEENALEVLSAVLSSLSMRIYQERGAWVIDRVADLVALRASSAVALDTPTLYFTEPAALSVSQPCGAVRLQLSTESNKNRLRYRLNRGQVSEEERFTSAYYKWTRKHATSVEVQEAQREGTDVKLSSIVPQSMRVAFRSRFPLADLIAPQTNLLSDKLTLSIDLHQQRSGVDDRLAYLSLRLCLLRGSQVKYVATKGLAGGLLSSFHAFESKEAAFVPIDNAYDYPRCIESSGLYDAPLVAYYSPEIDLSKSKQSVRFDVRLPQPGWQSEVDAVGLILTSYVLAGERQKSNDKSIQVVYDTERYSELRIGNVSIEVSELGPRDDGELTLQFNGKNSRRADDIDIRLRPYCPYVVVDAETRYALWRDRDMHQLCDALQLAGSAYRIEELAARDRLLHLATARTAVAGRLNAALLHSADQLYYMSTDPTRKLLATYASINLLDDSTEIELTQIIHPQKPSYEWQL